MFLAAALVSSTLQPQSLLSHTAEAAANVVLELLLDLEQGLGARNHVAECGVVLLQPVDGDASSLNLS